MDKLFHSKMIGGGEGDRELRSHMKIMPDGGRERGKREIPHN